MADDFEVKVNSYGPGRNLVLRYTDPITGKRRAESAGTTDRKEALLKAGALRDKLREGKYVKPSKVTWQDFTWRYCDEVVPGLAPGTGRKVKTAFNAVERILAPKQLANLKAAQVSHLAAKLRQEGKSEATIHAYLAHLHAALAWAADVGILRELPKFPKTKRGKGQKIMKGRPITAEEFERMLAAVPKVLTGQDREPKIRKARKPAAKRRQTPKPKKPVDANPAAVAAWEKFLRGLWWSGLRLGESLELSWDSRAGLSVDLNGKRPMLRIRAGSQKSGKEQLCPIAPEFAELLLTVPESDRRGRVFRLVGQAGTEARDLAWVSAVICRIGKAARVKVDERTKRKPDPKAPGGAKLVNVVKYASAHDLRRSFGFRWSRRILPAELRELMRHADIQTTMRYYVGQEAETTADALWAAYEKANGGNDWPVGNTRGNTAEIPAESAAPRNNASR